MDQGKKRKKIKKVRVWPSVIGIILSIIVVPTLFVAFISLYVSGIASTRFVEGMEASQRVLEDISVEASKNTSIEGAIKEVFDHCRIMMPNVKGLYILDSKGNISTEYGLPGKSLTELSRANVEGDIKIYVEDELKDILTIDEDSFTVDGGFLAGPVSSIRELRKIINFSDDSTRLGKEILGFDIWFFIDDGSFPDGALIRYRLSFSLLDYIYILGIFAVSLVVFIVLLCYHISSITRRVRFRSRLYDVMYNDNETGGKNLLFFYRKAWELTKGKGKTRKYAMVNIRCEKFRSLRSCYGVRWAGELSTALYEYMRKIITNKEALCYMENGDFGLFLQYIDEESLNARIRQLMDRLALITPDHRMYYSAGVCAVPAPKSDMEAILNNAANARSTITDATAGEIKWFSKELHEAQVWERKVEAQMKGAMERREFQMYLQPKYTANGEELGGAEALVRWIHPTEGFISPGKFIPIFEKNGFIITLDDFMISEVARHQAKWLREGRKLVPVSVNVSRAHFLNEDLAEHIRDIVDSYGVPHEFIELEITESAFFDDKKTLINTVKKMQSYGFPVSMDDFGAGYSSLNSLKELPLDVIKLDADFFRGEDNGERGKVIVSETIDLAKMLGMHIVAEGIETREQVDFLKEQDCDLIQGFFFAKPMPVNEFEERMSRIS